MSCTPTNYSVKYTATFYGENLPLCDGDLSDKEVICKIAEYTIKGLSEFLLRHTNDEEDKIIATNIINYLKGDKKSTEHDGFISELSQNLHTSHEMYETKTLMNQLMKKYDHFIKVLDDSELCINKSTPVIYCEFEQKIKCSDITATYNKYVFNNPGISIKKPEDGIICFPIFAIPKKTKTALDTSDPCTIL